jgi:hypothetical protein
LITTGHWRDAQNADLAREIEQATRQARRSPREQLELRKRFPKLDTPNVAFRNNQDLTFTETGVTWGFDSRRISQGMALADLDNDGDLDAVINCLNDGPLLLRNESVRPRIAVRLRGRPPNTRGVGARIRVVLPDLPVQSQEMICGGRYLSSDDFQRTFAAGSSSSRATIEVLWRDGARTVLTNAPVNHLYEIQEPPASTVSARLERPPPASPGNGPWFEEVSGRLGNGHCIGVATEPDQSCAAHRPGELREPDHERAGASRILGRHRRLE